MIMIIQIIIERSLFTAFTLPIGTRIGTHIGYTIYKYALIHGLIYNKSIP